MELKQLQIHQFRNIETASIALAPGFNVFVGENGSGKTSILEAIYYLAMAKSFRSHYSRYIIRDGQSALTVYATAAEQATFGISKSRQGPSVQKYCGEVVASKGEWVRKLPVLIVNHESYQLLDAGPQCRRQFIDWGVFHVKHHFLDAFQIVQKALSQRNAALRAELPVSDVLVWDEQLVAATLTMTALREAYLEAFMPVFQAKLAHFLALEGLTVVFYPGWPPEQDYRVCLKESVHRDRQYGYTRQGPHRADLRFLIQGKPVDETLSRGQQKVFVAALKLAQAQTLRDQAKHCLVLVDDLPSELDLSKQQDLIQQLDQISPQVLVTGINHAALSALFSPYPTTMFHVKQGEIVTC